MKGGAVPDAFWFPNNPLPLKPSKPAFTLVVPNAGDSDDVFPPGFTNRLVG